VSEACLDFGPGYCVYYTQRESIIVILLIGGSNKTQLTDIAIAKRHENEISE
jgi:putative addiction module killer protein